MKTRPSDYLNTVQLLNQLVEEAAGREGQQ